jgi:hypothetical protein
LPPGKERGIDQLITLLLALSLRQAGVGAVLGVCWIMPAIGGVELFQPLLSGGLLNQISWLNRCAGKVNLGHTPLVAITVHQEVVRPADEATAKGCGDDRRFLRATGDVDVIPRLESPGVCGAGGG